MFAVIFSNAYEDKKIMKFNLHFCNQLIIAGILSFFYSLCLGKIASASEKNLSTGSVDIQNINNLSKTTFNNQQSEQSIAEIAKQITVRIFTNPGAGSGIIISRKGEIYTVLTCAHVANPSDNDRYSLLAPDGRTYPASRKPLPGLERVDLALIEFKSKASYTVATLATRQNIKLEEKVYAAGFPNYHDNSSNVTYSTLTWGLRSFNLTKGIISMLLSDRALPRGYQIGYTNNVEVGMSGGPVLDSNGQVLGINGRHKYPLEGIDAFRFADGTSPSEEIFKQMNPLSWAIPISIFQEHNPQYGYKF